MPNDLSSVIPLIISIISLFISLCSTFYYTRHSNRLAAQTQLADLIDKIFILSAERQSLILKAGKPTQEIANIQLQMKHLLFEIDQMANMQTLSQPQNRLLADTFEDLLFFAYAQKYWNKVFEKPFAMPELAAEHYRRYGQFLYRIGDYTKGISAFEKSLSLPNDTENKLYINFQTYTDWASLEYKREMEDYTFNIKKGRNVPFPEFEQVHSILNRAQPLLESFNSYGFYENALREYKGVIRLIETAREINSLIK